MNRKIVYIDMDGVLCNFSKAFNQKRIEFPEQLYPQSEYGFFLNLEPIKDAIESFRILESKYDVWILTRPSVLNPLCYTEKALWVRNNLGIEVQKRTIMSCDKSLLKGDYLIDDTTEHGQLEFDGEFLKFGSDRFENWKLILDYLM